MGSIHPSENPPLGWLVPCLAVADLQASLEFYAKFDLVQYGGDVAEKWAMLRNRAIEIHLFQGHIPTDLLNFRGGDLPEIRRMLTGRGLVVSSEQGGVSFIYKDPDGREVFFDTSEEEDEAYPSGRSLTLPIPGDDVHEGTGLDLGNLTCCFACRSLEATAGFYETLGFVRGGGSPGWAILARPDHLPLPGVRLIETHLSLFEGMIPTDMLNFRGGDVGAIAEVLSERGVDLGAGVEGGPDGGESLRIPDPDGRQVFLDTTPPERLYRA